MDRICYKCVYTRDMYNIRTYHSALHQSLRDFSLCYEIGKETFPKIGRIFVFKTFDDARNFANSNSSVCHIMEGLAKNIGKPFVLSYEVNDHHIKNFWGYKKSKTMILEQTRTAPDGTFSCSSFTPNKIVWAKY